MDAPPTQANARANADLIERIDAQFSFNDGLITNHHDHFDFWVWSRQALGVPGWLLGWSPMLRRKLAARAASNLTAFRSQAS